MALTFGLSLSGWKDFSNYAYFPILTLIARLDFYLIGKALSMKIYVLGIFLVHELHRGHGLFLFLYI
jgi:hypothetical protein